MVDELERTRCETYEASVAGYSTASRNASARKEDCRAQRVGEEVWEGKEQIVAAWGRDWEERHDQNQARSGQHQNQDDESPGDQSIIHFTLLAKQVRDKFQMPL